MSLGKGKGIFTFDFNKFIFTVNVYLSDLYDLVLKLWRQLRRTIYFVQLIMVEFAKCGISREVFSTQLVSKYHGSSMITSNR